MRAVQRVQRVAQRRTRPTKAKAQSRDLDRPPVDLGRKTYLTVAQTMEYLEFPSQGAVYMWAQRHRVPKCRVGRLVRFLRRDLDEIVQQGRQREAASR